MPDLIIKTFKALNSETPKTMLDLKNFSFPDGASFEDYRSGKPKFRQFIRLS